MKNLIHELVTDIKYLYPCIAYEDGISEEELVITTETTLSRIYPVKLIVTDMEFVGEDFWGRPSFKDKNEQYYCELDGSLYFKGNDMDGEPHWPVNKTINYEFPDVDSELIEFKPFIDKVKEYLFGKKGMELVEANPSLQLNSNSVLESKIFCSYRIKLNKKEE